MARIVDEALLKRIQSDPRIAAGRPVVRGMRLTVEFILNLLEHGSTRANITQEYAGLSEADIQACILFEESARAESLRQLLSRAENDVSSSRVRSIRSFLKEFKADRNIR